MSVRYIIRHAKIPIETKPIKNQTKFYTALKTAQQAAMNAKHRHRLAAIIIRGGKVSVVAWNHSHVHAERSAISRAHGIDIEGSTLLVIRCKRDGTLGMALPCPECRKHISAAGIKNVVFSNNNGILESFSV